MDREIIAESSSVSGSDTKGVQTLRSRDGKFAGSVHEAVPPYETLEAEDGGVAVDADTGDAIVKGPAEKDDILTHTMHVEDDPSLNSLTFRTFFLGVCHVILND